MLFNFLENVGLEANCNFYWHSIGYNCSEMPLNPNQPTVSVL